MLDHELDVVLAEWEKGQSARDTMDPIWTLVAYRFARLALERARTDAGRSPSAARRDVRDQLLRAVASISANVGEGYSRASPAERSRFYGYALGSAREATAWYEAIRSEMTDAAFDERLSILNRIRRLLFGMLKAAQRSARKTFKP